MKHTHVAAVLAALMSSLISFSVHAAGEETHAGPDASTHETVGLPNLEFSVDRLFSGRRDSGNALSKSSYGFSYGGSWETSEPNRAVQRRKSIYAHH